MLPYTRFNCKIILYLTTARRTIDAIIFIRRILTYNFVREPLSIEQADALCHACESVEDKLIVFTLLDTGLRLAELTSLTDQSILWQEKRLLVNGKGNKKRKVPMTIRVRALLEPYFTLNKGWFVKERMVQRRLKEIAQRAKIPKPVSPHVLRHTFAVECLRKDINIRTLQKLLGHDSIHTTIIYLNINDEHITQEFERKW